jgi:hypothetical protein
LTDPVVAGGEFTDRAGLTRIRRGRSAEMRMKSGVKIEIWLEKRGWKRKLDGR